MIEQGYASAGTRQFGFIEKFKLDNYTDTNKSLIVFGCWNAQDIEVVNNHKGDVYVRWDGGDARTYAGGIRRKFVSIAHASFLQKVLKEKGIESLIERRLTDKGPVPTRCGDKIYTYITKVAPELYGLAELEKINTNRIIIYPNGVRMPGERFVLHGAVNKKSWDRGLNNFYYGMAFIGLLLSKYVGGCITIEELGLRGIYVVTNILDLPHCIPWHSVEEIERAIKSTEQYIGRVNVGLAHRVYDAMVDVRNTQGYDFDNYVNNKMI